MKASRHVTPLEFNSLGYLVRDLTSLDYRVFRLTINHFVVRRAVMPSKSSGYDASIYFIILFFVFT